MIRAKHSKGLFFPIPHARSAEVEQIMQGINKLETTGGILAVEYDPIQKPAVQDLLRQVYSRLTSENKKAILHRQPLFAMSKLDSSHSVVIYTMGTPYLLHEEHCFAKRIFVIACPRYSVYRTARLLPTIVVSLPVVPEDMVKKFLDGIDRRIDKLQAESEDVKRVSLYMALFNSLGITTHYDLLARSLHIDGDSLQDILESMSDEVETTALPNIPHFCVTLCGEFIGQQILKRYSSAEIVKEFQQVLRSVDFDDSVHRSMVMSGLTQLICQGKRQIAAAILSGLNASDLTPHVKMQEACLWSAIMNNFGYYDKSTAILTAATRKYPESVMVVHSYIKTLALAIMRYPEYAEELAATIERGRQQFADDPFIVSSVRIAEQTLKKMNNTSCIQQLRSPTYNESNRGSDLEGDIKSEWTLVEKTIFLCEQATLLIDKGCFDRANSLIDTVLQLDSNHFCALALKAEVLGNKGNWVQAQQVLNKLLILDPDNEQGLLCRATMAIEQMRLKYGDRLAPRFMRPAVRDLEAVLRIQPFNLQAHVHSAMLAARQGNYDTQSTQWLRQAQDPIAVATLAHIEAMQNMDSTPVESLEVVAQHFPELAVSDVITLYKKNSKRKATVKFHEITKNLRGSTLARALTKWSIKLDHNESLTVVRKLMAAYKEEQDNAYVLQAFKRIEESMGAAFWQEVSCYIPLGDDREEFKSKIYRVDQILLI